MKSGWSSKCGGEPPTHGYSRKSWNIINLMIYCRSQVDHTECWKILESPGVFPCNSFRWIPEVLSVVYLLLQQHLYNKIQMVQVHHRILFRFIAYWIFILVNDAFRATLNPLNCFYLDHSLLVGAYLWCNKHSCLWPNQVNCVNCELCPKSDWGSNACRSENLLMQVYVAW